MSKLIGFAGFKGSGKSESALYLERTYDYRLYSFAGPLKAGVNAFFGWTENQGTDPILKEVIDPAFGVSPRLMYQLFGTEVLREFIPSLSPELKEKVGNNFWVSRFQSFVKNNCGLSFTLGDVRFQNEVDAIHSLGGVVVKIQRDIAIPKVISHPSENINLLENIDYVVDNNGTKQELYGNLDVLVKNL
jgi:hypothetical protein